MSRIRRQRVPRWRARFLSELAELGHVKLACSRAPVDPSHVYRLRKNDLAFAADWDEAVASARARLALRQSPHDTGEGDALYGELVIVGRDNPNGPRLFTPRANGWTRAKEEDFLKALANTCNVTLAAREAGVTASAAYQRRLHWEVFAQAWDEALANGMADLELRLIAEMQTPFDAEAVAPAGERPIKRVDDAINLLQIHIARQNKPPPPRIPKNFDEVRASILRKVLAIRRGRVEDGRACPTCGRDYDRRIIPPDSGRKRRRACPKPGSPTV